MKQLTAVEGVYGGMRRMGWWFALAALLMLPAVRCANAQGVSTTTVQGTVYLANGQPGGGTLVLSWPSFSTASGQAIAADQLTLTIPADGFVSVNLAPNQGATPAGEYYTATYYMSDGSTNTEYWVVPAGAQVTIAQVRAQVMPAAQAVQAVTKSYVDQSIAELQLSGLTASGGTLTGPLILSGDPTQPLQAADKHYVDSEAATAVPLSGGAMTGPLTLSSDPSQAMQAADKEYVDTAAATAWPAMVVRVDQLAGANFGAKLQACLSIVNSTYGGICDARNFTGNQTISSNLTVSVANTTVLLPCATISTANQIVVTAGTRNVALRGCALRGGSTASASQGGTAFAYSGAAALIQVGDPTYASDTVGFHLDNLVINTTAATSAAAMGLAAYRTQEIDLASVYFLGNANQTGMKLDGTGNYTGGTFLDDQFDGFLTAVNAIGHQVANPATTDWMNASSFLRIHINCPISSGNPIAGTYGINLQQGDGNTFTGGDVEGCATAVHLGLNAQNNTIVGLRNGNSTMQVVADAGSSYNNWITGGTMLAGQLSDSGTRNSFQDAFHRSFNGLNGDWYGSQQDATLTNHFRLGIGAGNERGLLDRYQTDYGYRWTTGLSDAATGEQFYEILDELNNVNRISIGQYNNGQPSTNNQTAINSAGTGAVLLNGLNNAGTGGVVIGSGGPSETTVASISNAGNAQFNGTLQVGGTAQFTGAPTVRNNADAEVDYFLWPGLTASQKGAFTYKDWNGTSEWSMLKDASNNWAVNSAVGGLDSFKAYQSTNGGDTYVDASSSAGTVRVNYETGSGAAFKVYGGNSSTLYASFTGATTIAFPGLAATSGHSCLQIDTSGNVTNTGAACGSGSGGSGTVGSSNAGYIAYYTSSGTTLGGMSSVPVTAGGTGATTAAGALAGLGALPLAGGALTGPITAPAINQVWDLKQKFGATGSNATMTCTSSVSGTTLTSCSGGDFAVGNNIYIPQAGALSTLTTPSAPTATCGVDNGGSCTGATVYCYKIAATQTGYYNPPMSQPSSSTCVTQATQTAQTASHNTAADVYTTVSWTAVTNAAGYSVYKSINSGPYNFYEVVGSGTTSVKDFNHAPSAQFTCIDMGYPCTAPSGKTASGVLAQITNIVGSTYTITARSTQPSDPSVPGIAGSVTVQHDDSPAFSALYTALIGNSGNGVVQVHIPAGNYMVHGYNDPAGSGYETETLALDGLSNVVFSGDGPGVTNILQQDGSFAFGACGYGASVGCLTLSLGGTGSGYTIVDPATAGTNQVTLSTPTNASYFSIGGYVTIFDNAASYPYKDYGEINKVLAINTTTGALTLAYPLDKTYSATLPAPYSTCASCSATPMVYPIGGSATASNITFQNLTIRGAVQNLFNYNTIDGLYFFNDDLEAQGFQIQGQSRHFGIYNSKIVEDPWSPGSQGGMLEGAAASGDLTAEGNTYIAPHYSSAGRQECSEGSANIFDINNTQSFSGSTDPSAAPTGGSLFGISMCWNYTLANNTVTLNNTALTGLIGGDSGAGGGGSIRDNTFSIDSVSGSSQASIETALTFGYPFDSPYSALTGNQWLVASGGANLGPISVNAEAFQPTHGSLTFTATSGNFAGIASNYYAADLFVVNLTAGDAISGVYLGVTRQANYLFRVAFVQPASGSASYFQSPGCSSSFWGINIDCSNQRPPSLQSANSAVTILTFWDDGTTVHYLGKNFNDYQFTSPLSFGNAGGGVLMYSQYGTFGVATMSMTSNITSVNLGSTRIAGYFFTLGFTQPATGGPFTLPTSCSNIYWATGNGIQCSGGTAPAANPAASSTTFVSFYDDGTNIWVLGSSYSPTVTDGSGTTTVGQIAESTSTAHQVTYSSALPNGTTATTQTSGDNSTKIATTAYVASPGAITPTVVTATGLVTGANDTTRTTSTTMTNAWTTTGLVLPTVPVSTTKAGRCVIYWQMSSTSYTATFGLGMSSAPTDVWGGSSVTYAAAGTSNWLAFTQTATTTTAISAASTAGVAATTYRAEVDFTIQTGATNPVAMTIYGETSSASGTLTIEPGSTCYWLP